MKRARTLKGLFGILKGHELDAQKIKDELRKEDAERDKKLSKLLRKRNMFAK